MFEREDIANELIQEFKRVGDICDIKVSDLK